LVKGMRPGMTRIMRMGVAARERRERKDLLRRRVGEEVGDCLYNRVGKTGCDGYRWVVKDKPYDVHGLKPRRVAWSASYIGERWQAVRAHVTQRCQGVEGGSWGRPIVHQSYKGRNCWSCIGSEGLKCGQRPDREVVPPGADNPRAHSKGGRTSPGPEYGAGEVRAPGGRFIADPFDEERKSIRREGPEAGGRGLRVEADLQYQGVERNTIVLGFGSGEVSEQSRQGECGEQYCRGDEGHPHD